ncbi:MAG: transposase [Alphaproteobacteria bacterium]
MLARLYRRLLIERLEAAFAAGALRFAGALSGLARPAACARHLREARQLDWIVYAKRPFASPEQILNYPGRYTHRVAIAKHRLLSLDDNGHASFRWKDYRHHHKTKVMTLKAHEFLRRFLLHVLPDSFRRIRHNGFLANGHRTKKLAILRALLAVPAPSFMPPPADCRERHTRLTGRALDVCSDCGGRMVEWRLLARAADRPKWNDSS